MMGYKDVNKEKLIREALREKGREKLPADFTMRIMEQLVHEKKPVITYKPLISRTGWMVVAAAVMAVLGLAFFSGSDTGVVNFTLPELPKIKLPRFTGYSIGLIFLLILVQIPLLKIYHSKKLG
ncbi:hypothetical protein SAMN02927921_00193 [Sinomicrobium oceani]|uniref:Uncharacterized protein n=1 Tax=Sinomicrobium oceani TaxID=1150368 RepID=A0A1K1LRE3_9FLAO|nr:hypothetical protein [Sinomicrobium oceani]SFW13442.1 hypothetical protein SAMN02927921_00193 [Sinomicrobium oceani]